MQTHHGAFVGQAPQLIEGFEVRVGDVVFLHEHDALETLAVHQAFEDREGARIEPLDVAQIEKHRGLPTPVAQFLQVLLEDLALAALHLVGRLALDLLGQILEGRDGVVDAEDGQNEACDLDQDPAEPFGLADLAADRLEG